LNGEYAMMLEKELATALLAAEAACDYLRSAYTAFEVIPNAPACISTVADSETQEIILKQLHAAFPDDQLRAEETTATLKLAPLTASRTWIVDPIDGTRGFARKNGEFSVMIGLVQDQRPILGVVAEPLLNRVTYATRGGGCWVRVGDMEPQRCHVSGCTDLAETTLVRSHRDAGRGPTPREIALNCGKTIATYSAGIKLAMIARGEAEVYLNSYVGFHDWDVCAGEALVLEAGGVVSEVNGKSIEYGSPSTSERAGMVATTQRLHPAVLQCLASV
jgi:3'(2'), 5'-bisphosphate nucleotidase